MKILFIVTMLIASLFAQETNQTTTKKGKLIHLEGQLVTVGSKATKVSLVSSSMKKIDVGGKTKNTQVLVVVPSIDTPVCDLEARTFNEKASKLKNVNIIVISMDLPFAGKRFCAAHGIDNVTLASDFQTKAFGKAYGVLIKDTMAKGLLARTIFIVKDGVVTYKQLVPDLTHQPDYEDVLKHI